MEDPTLLSAKCLQFLNNLAVRRGHLLRGKGCYGANGPHRGAEGAFDERLSDAALGRLTAYDLKPSSTLSAGQRLGRVFVYDGQSRIQIEPDVTAASTGGALRFGLAPTQQNSPAKKMKS